MKRDTSPTPKRSAAIYREAARLIAVGERLWSCCAVEQAILGWRYNSASVPVNWSIPTRRYRKLFAEEDGRMTIRQFDHASDGKHLRVLALCFMAAMVEAGDA